MNHKNVSKTIVKITIIYAIVVGVLTYYFDDNSLSSDNNDNIHNIDSTDNSTNDTDTNDKADSNYEPIDDYMDSPNMVDGYPVITDGFGNGYIDKTLSPMD